MEKVHGAQGGGERKGSRKEGVHGGWGVRAQLEEMARKWEGGGGGESGLGREGGRKWRKWRVRGSEGLGLHWG